MNSTRLAKQALRVLLGSLFSLVILASTALGRTGASKPEGSQGSEIDLRGLKKVLESPEMKALTAQIGRLSQLSPAKWNGPDLPAPDSPNGIPGAPGSGSGNGLSGPQEYNGCAQFLQMFAPEGGNCTGIQWKCDIRDKIRLLIEEAIRKGIIGKFTGKILLRKFEKNEEFWWIDPVYLLFPCEAKLWNGLMKLLKSGEKLFNWLDRDGNGEFCMDDIWDLINQLDLNHNGTVCDQDDLLLLQALLYNFDANGDGVLDAQEWSDLIKAVSPELAPILDEFLEAVRAMTDAIEFCQEHPPVLISLNYSRSDSAAIPHARATCRKV